MNPIRERYDLSNERARQKRYHELVRQQESQQQTHSDPGSNPWTRTGVPKNRVPTEGRLIGRVAVRETDDLFAGRCDFYIGDKHLTLDDVEVFSWAAPIASTLFRKPNGNEFYDQVTVTRTFRHLRGDIIDYEDNALVVNPPRDPFPHRRLTIPTAPSMPAAPVFPEMATTDADRRQTSDSSTSVPRDPQGERPYVRAESLLRRELRAPRTSSLNSVLATLQPDQYGLVTTPASRNLVIEGRPGTGKTIVGAHRAAYLLHHDTPAARRLTGDILVIGPTNEHAQHIRGAVVDLRIDPTRIDVLSIPQLLGGILNTKGSRTTFTPPKNWRDVDEKLGRFARSAIRRLSRQGRSLSIRSVYEELRTHSVASAHAVTDPEWNQYLRSLPKYESAVAGRDCGPLRAFISWELNSQPHLVGVRHMIVDEAQDVTPLEWMLLSNINRSGTWTILGDLDQRRSDFTLSNWEAISDLLAVDEGLRIHKLEHGYRSTRKILEFAAKLLPRKSRKVHAFQDDGPDPVIHRAKADTVQAAVMQEAQRLLRTYDDGTVAIISISPQAMWPQLRRNKWWARSSSGSEWEKEGHRLTIIAPDTARGLEFDAVVIVEPADFPETYGRHGVLYTALTRPNRELVIVHSKPLPDPLKRRGVRTLNR